MFSNPTNAHWCLEQPCIGITPIKFCFKVLEELYPVVAMLQQEIESKKLDQDDMFYRCLKDALEFAQKSSNLLEYFKDNESVTYMQTLDCYGKAKTMNLLKTARS